MIRQGSLPAQRLPHDTKLLSACDLLLEYGADQMRHAHGRSLMAHLLGTATLLVDWNAPVDIVRAGLCHSIYGTNAFRRATLAEGDRHFLQLTIGKRAEALVWWFSRLKRPATILAALRNNSTLIRLRSGHSRRIDPAVLRQLFVLECANLLDQGISIERVRRLRRQAFSLSLDHTSRYLDAHLRRRMALRCKLIGTTAF